jgi:very-short-patch-repair endonuclease
LRRHGLRAPEGDTVDLLVPTVSQRKSVGFVRLRRTRRMPATHSAHGSLRWVHPARAVADLALQMTSLAEVRSVIADSIQRGRCSFALLRDELRAGPMRGSALFRQALGEIADGIRSAAEGDLHDLIRKAGLPLPLFNAKLFVDGEIIAVPDCWWPQVGVAVEVDSREWHFSPHDWEKTMRRHEAMGAHGIITLHFTPRRIREEPAEVVKAIREALAAAEHRPPLLIRTVQAAA